MKFIKQLSIILIISFIGEILNKIIPLHVPACIYGLLILFFCLKTKIIPLYSVKYTAKLLIEIMPLMFIPAAVELIDVWHLMQNVWLQYLTLTVVSTIIVMAVTGKSAQLIIEKFNKKEIKNENNF